MAANDSQRGGPYYGAAAAYRSRDGLSTRQSVTDEIHLTIDQEFDHEITGLRTQIHKLKGVAQEINSEAKYQNHFLNQLHMTMIKAEAGVKNNMRRINRSIVQSGSSHLVHVIAFALVICFLIYLYAKVSRK